jgi:hypothetical protein
VFGPCNRGLQYLLGADFALGDEPGERDGVVLAIFLEPHGLQIPGLKPVENEYSCSHPATSYFIISAMLAQMRRTHDHVSALAPTQFQRERDEPQHCGGSRKF